MPNEPHARIKINKLLEAAGWRLLDDENGQANVQLESGVTITQDDIDDLGDDLEKTTHGFIDYLLLDESKFPIAVLEAKREDKIPITSSLGSVMCSRMGLKSWKNYRKTQWKMID